MHYYILLLISVLLFSLQFLFNQKFQEKFGSELDASMSFSFLSSVCGIFVLVPLNGFKLDFSVFSFVVGIFYSLVGIFYTYASIKAFGRVNLSAYSVSAMLGGMLLPSIYGIVFSNEGFTFLKLACYLFTIAALLFTVDFKAKKGGAVYYFAVFVLNGLTGVISAFHQSFSACHVSDSLSFLILARISGTLMCVPFLLKRFTFVKNTLSVHGFIYSLCYAACCGVGNLFVLTALKYLPASVQYPIITGGVMLTSLVISLIRRERVYSRNVIASVSAFASTLLLAFSS